MRIARTTTQDGMIIVSLVEDDETEHELQLSPKYVSGLISVLQLQLCEAAASPISMNRTMPRLSTVLIRDGADGPTVQMHMGATFHEYPVRAGTTLAGDVLACAELLLKRQQERETQRSRSYKDPLQCSERRLVGAVSEIGRGRRGGDQPASGEHDPSSTSATTSIASMSVPYGPRSMPRKGESRSRHGPNPATT